MNRGSAILVLWMWVGSALPATPSTGEVRFSQGDFLVHSWRSEDGLPHNSVVSLAQTPDGYLWVGTRSGGLARFDGMRFVVFTPQNTPALQDVEIESLSVDRTGTLWVAAGNESIAAITEGRFRLIRTRHAPPRWHPRGVVADWPDRVLFSATGPSVHAVPRWGAVNQATRQGLTPPPLSLGGGLHQDEAGQVWYLTSDRQLARISSAGGEITLPSIPALPSGIVDLQQDAGRELWLATSSQLGVLRDNTFESRLPADTTDPMDILGITPTGDGGIWVRHRSGLRKLLADRWATGVIELPPMEEDGLPESPGDTPGLAFGDRQGGLWLIYYGLGLLHVKSDGRTQVLTRQTGLPSVLITCAMQDDEGNVWIGTRDAGLARIRTRLFRAYGVAEGIPGEAVQSVCEDNDGTLWVGTALGRLARLKEGRFENVPLLRPRNRTIESVTVYPDANEGIWVGTVGSGVQRVNQDRVSRPFPPRGATDVLMQDHDGRTWFGWGGGLSYWDGRTVRNFGSAQGFLDNVGVRALARDVDGTVWIGTGPGELWRLKQDQLKGFAPPSHWPLARIAMLLPDTNGTVWIGTLGGGLLYFADGRFSRVTSDHGLPDNSVTQLLEDGDGDLWGGTHAGIFRAAKSDLLAAASGQASRIPCPVYGRLDGLPSEECSGWFQPSCWRSRDGILWFATGKGLARLDPREVVVNQRPPPVVIEELRVDGSLREFTASASASAPRAPASGTEGHSDTLRIEPGRHYVEFRFTGLNFTAPGKVRFRWKLEGVEREWREGGNQRVVGYGPLLPGKYRFYVTASNNDGYWNQTGATLAFMVLPHVWETVWFKLVMTGAIFLALALALVSVLRRRHRMQLARLERQRAMEQERARIAQDLHDDLGTSLTQIGMLSSLISRATPTATQVQQLAQQIRSTSRTMVTALNDIVWAVNPKNDSLNELVGYLGDFAERFFSAGPLRCRLEIPADLPEHPLPSELRHGLFLAFKEALNNAAKHSGADKLWVRVALNEGCLSILVEDNGKGLDPKALATTRGNGLRNMRQRLERLGGTCTPTARPEGGTIVQFRLPLTGNDGE